MTREQAFAAIFALLEPLGPSPGDGTFKTVSRRLRLVETFDVEQMPAIFQQQLSEPIGPAQYTVSDGLVFSILNLCWYIYINQPDSDADMTPPLNAALDTVINGVFSASAPGQVAPGCVITVGEEEFNLLPVGIVYYEGLLGDGRAVARINLQAKPVNLP